MKKLLKSTVNFVLSLSVMIASKITGQKTTTATRRDLWYNKTTPITAMNMTYGETQ
jgi:hypothetical protein